MSRTVLASLFAVLVTSCAAPASAQVFYDPSTWFSGPKRPHYHIGYAQRPMPNAYPNMGRVLDCPDAICGPVNRNPANGNCANGQCGTVPPRYPVTVPHNGWRTPNPSSAFYSNSGIVPPQRRPIQDYRFMPSNYENDDWAVNRGPLPRRSYDSGNSPFYP
jgi:hypothetical protein